MKISLKRKKAGQKVMEVEAADLVIPEYPWLTGLHATPFIDGIGKVSDLWTITERSTGAQLRVGPENNIEELLDDLGAWIRFHNITPRRWKEILTRTRKQLERMK